MDHPSINLLNLWNQKTYKDSIAENDFFLPDALRVQPKMVSSDKVVEPVIGWTRRVWTRKYDDGTTVTDIFIYDANGQRWVEDSQCDW